MLPRLLDTQRYICLAANQTIQHYIEELRGIPNYLLMRSHSITLLEHAPTLIHTSLCARAHRSGILLLTVTAVELGSRNLLSHCSALASNRA